MGGVRQLPAPGPAQHWVSHALELDNHRVRTCGHRRMGGGFRADETQSGHLAVWAAVAREQVRSTRSSCGGPRRLIICRKAPPFTSTTPWADDDGLITRAPAHHAGQLRLQRRPLQAGGRPGGVTDNAYFLSDVDITSYRCKTNTKPPPSAGLAGGTCGA